LVTLMLPLIELKEDRLEKELLVIEIEIDSEEKLDRLDSELKELFVMDILTLSELIDSLESEDRLDSEEKELLVILMLILRLSELRLEREEKELFVIEIEIDSEEKLLLVTLMLKLSEDLLSNEREAVTLNDTPETTTDHDIEELTDSELFVMLTEK